MLHDFERSLSSDIQMKTVFDQSNNVQDRVSRFFGNLMQGIFLVGLVVFTAVSFRASMIVMLAFIPIILMQDVTGDFIRSMPLTVVYTLSASLLISLTLTPYLAAKFLKVDRDSKVRPFRHIWDAFIQNHYRHILDWVLRKPGMTLAVVIGLFDTVPCCGCKFFP